MKRSSKRSGLALVAVTLLPSASGSNIGPDFGKNKHNPSRDVYKTKADVVKLIQQAVADGANLIQEQGDAGGGGLLSREQLGVAGLAAVGFALIPLC